MQWIVRIYLECLQGGWVYYDIMYNNLIYYDIMYYNNKNVYLLLMI